MTIIALIKRDLKKELYFKFNNAHAILRILKLLERFHADNKEKNLDEKFFLNELIRNNSCIINSFHCERNIDAVDKIKENLYLYKIT